MRVHLNDLLKRVQIVHPTQIRNVVLENRTLRIGVGGWPWWRPETAPTEAQATLQFDNVWTGTLHISDFVTRFQDEDLEEFAILPASSQGWLQRSNHTIYSNAPVPDPVALFECLQDYMVKDNWPYGPGSYLNQGITLSGFRVLCASPSFCLGQFPESLLQPLLSELERQAVPYLKESYKAEDVEGWFVSLEDSWFLCSAA